jgi:FMN phosphatase YigB (HAD superfamily)
MMASRDRDQTNKEVFDAYIKEAVGIDMGEPEHEQTIQTFYREVFPTLQGNARAVAGAREAITMCQSLGLQVAVATQPIFPARAIEARLKWAGLDGIDLPVVSTYENSFSTKPHRSYFVQMAQRIGVDPTQCIMVGDDASMDMGAAQLGMKTYYVGSEPEVECDWKGTLEDFLVVLPNLLAS